MHTYISLLRGINVGGRNKIKMADLKLIYQQFGHQDVQHYIQSGNIIFKSTESDIPVLENQIKDQILKDYGYQIKIMIKKADIMKTIVESNPFLKGRDEDIKFLSLSFLSEIPSSDLVDNLKDFQYKTDEFAIHENLIFLFTPGGYGTTKLSNNFFERKLKVSATTRNWKTILKLQSMLSSSLEK